MTVFFRLPLNIETGRLMRTDDVIGLIPCGGIATRVAPLPCSKELFPIGLNRMADGSPRPKVVSHYLLEKMHQGGVRKVFFILRSGKWDIPQYYGNGTPVGMDLGYLIMGKPLWAALHSRSGVSLCQGSACRFRFPRHLVPTARCVQASLRAPECHAGGSRSRFVPRPPNLVVASSYDRSHRTRARSLPQPRKDENKVRVGLRGMDVEVHGVYARVSRFATNSG